MYRYEAWFVGIRSLESIAGEAETAKFERSKFSAASRKMKVLWAWMGGCNA